MLEDIQPDVPTVLSDGGGGESPCFKQLKFYRGNPRKHSTSLIPIEQGLLRVIGHRSGHAARNVKHVLEGFFCYLPRVAPKVHDEDGSVFLAEGHAEHEQILSTSLCSRMVHMVGNRHDQSTIRESAGTTEMTRNPLYIRGPHFFANHQSSVHPNETWHRIAPTSSVT